MDDLKVVIDDIQATLDRDFNPMYITITVENWTRLKDASANARSEIEKARREAIEECAKKVENCKYLNNGDAEGLAYDIRSLGEAK